MMRGCSGTLVTCHVVRLFIREVLLRLGQCLMHSGLNSAMIVHTIRNPDAASDSLDRESIFGSE